MVVDGTTAARPDLGEYVAAALRPDLASFAIPTRRRFQTEELAVLGWEMIDKHTFAAELTAGETCVPAPAVAKS